METQTELLSLNNHRALGEWVIVAPSVIEEAGITSRSSQFEDRPNTGLVVSVGSDVTSFAEGDVIFFGQYSHVQVTHDDIYYLIMREEDIYCVA